MADTYSCRETATADSSSSSSSQQRSGTRRSPKVQTAQALNESDNEVAVSPLAYLPFPPSIAMVKSGIQSAASFLMSKSSQMTIWEQICWLSVQLFTCARFVWQGFRDWTPANALLLEEAEQKLLTYLKYAPNGYFVDIGSGFNLDSNFIWTLEFIVDRNSNDIDVCTNDDSLANADISQSSELSTSQEEPHSTQDQCPNLSEIQADDQANNQQVQQQQHRQRTQSACQKPDYDCSRRRKRHEKSDPTPLLLLHGLGTGSAIWLANFDHIIEYSNRDIYAIDLLGLGRSSRPNFGNCKEIEWQLVYSIERWRKLVNLNRKFVLCGHGYGAYLALSYAIHFPQHVAHLITVDPWGLLSQHQSQQLRSTSYYTLPYWIKLVDTYFMQKVSPLTWIKMLGPYGATVLSTCRSDLRAKFEPIVGRSNTGDIINYVYQCCAQPNNSGEVAFKLLSTPSGWPKHPIIHRIRSLDRDIKISFIFGSRTWIDRQPAYQIKFLLGEDRVSINVIQGAGHHVYADRAHEFNNLICQILRFVDNQANYTSSMGSTDDYSYTSSD